LIVGKDSSCLVYAHGDSLFFAGVIVGRVPFSGRGVAGVAAELAGGRTLGSSVAGSTTGSGIGFVFASRSWSNAVSSKPDPRFSFQVHETAAYCGLAEMRNTASPVIPAAGSRILIFVTIFFLQMIEAECDSRVFGATDLRNQSDRSQFPIAHPLFTLELPATPGNAELREKRVKRERNWMGC
jgi:hypothetical protein